MKLFAYGILAFSLTFPALSHASKEAKKSDLCQQEIAAICEDLKGRKRKACISDNLDKFSAECQAELSVRFAKKEKAKQKGNE